MFFMDSDIFERIADSARIYDEAWCQILEKEGGCKHIFCVTRCKDCGYFTADKENKNVGECGIRSEPVFAGDFCSKAKERKEETVEFTDEERRLVKKLYDMGIETIEYDKVNHGFNLYKKGIMLHVTNLSFPTMIKNKYDIISIERLVKRYGLK